MIGSSRSHYTIESRIGEGGMGEVYRARDMKLGRSVAIKLLPIGSAENAESIHRFIREAKAASSLNHPNIVTIHEIGEDDSGPFIVMEHIAGAPLSRDIGAPMPLERFFEYALQITGALAAAHEAGVVHRDIKPANIMVTNSGLIKVVDFGLARLAPMAATDQNAPTAQVTSPQTTPGSILGTVGYMSPEQIEGAQAGPRSDVFSLGIVLHEMLSGRPLFRGNSTIATLTAILRDEPPKLSSIRKDIPSALSTLIARCMTKDPAARHADAGEIHRQLMRIKESLEESGKRPWLLRPPGQALIAVVLVALAVTAFLWWRRHSRQMWARNVAIPEVERLAAADNLDAAYRLALQAREVLPEDPQLQQLWTNLTYPLKIESDPPGAQVSFKVYAAPANAPWISMGTTPTQVFHLPVTLLRFRLTREGYTPLEVAPETDVDVMKFKLHRLGELPPRMVAVRQGTTEFQDRSVEVPEFWIDQFEVTNREFKRFVDEGGYRRTDLWKHPIEQNGRTLPLQEAMQLFVDSTGRPGPATWELGSFAEGQGDHPVDGVSWYEAAAYAQFVGKSLPTVYHWSRAATDFSVFSDVLTSSNFGGKGSVAAGSMPSLGPHGTFDMAGNVKEWCSNPNGNHRYLLGGAWFEASYTYLEADAQPPLDRRRGFGFRLMKTNTPPSADLAAEVVPVPYTVPPVVDDATYATYARVFDYDPIPLDAKVEERDASHGTWIREKVTITAAYGGERIPMFLFLPKNARPPFQTVVFFPGSDAIFVKSSRNLWLRMVDFYVKSGRVVVYPVYKGTYERGVPDSQGPIARRDLRIQRVKDVRRVADYIASRPDLDASRMLYYGLSLGANQAPFVLATDPRFKAAVLYAGGFGRSALAPEVQPQNYWPRVKVPLLLVTGRHDFQYPYETSQKPLMNLLGTAPENKRHVALDGGHLPPQYAESVKEMLAWADRWLGPVATK